MKISRPTVISLRPPTMARLGLRVLLAIGVVALIVSTMWLTLAWHNTKAITLQRLSIASTLAAGHTASLLDLVHDHIEHLAIDLARDVAQSNRAHAQETLARFVGQHEQLSAASIVAPDGQVWITTAAPLDMPLPTFTALSTDARNDFFEDVNNDGFRIARPLLSPLTRRWVLPLRYVSRQADGTPGPVIEADIDLERQQKLWRNLPLEADAALGLIRDDGFILSQWSQSNDLSLYRGDVRNTPLFQAIAGRDLAGTFDSTTLGGDGVAISYTRVQRYPVYAYLSVPAHVVRSTWLDIVQLPIVLIGSAFALSALIYAGLARRFANRMEIIRGRLAGTNAANNETLPPSGVVEIDVLCNALADARDRLREASRNREKQLLAAAEAGTYTVRRNDGVVTAADAAFAAMLGKTPEQVVGRKWESLLTPASTEMTTPNEAADDWSSQVVKFRHQSGDAAWLTLAEFNEDRDGIAVRQGLAIDVTQRESLLRKVHAQSVRLHALWELVTNRAMTDDQRIALTLRFGLERLSMDVVMVCEVRDQHMVVRQVAGTAILFAVGQEIPLNSMLCQVGLQSRRGVFIADLAADPRYRHHPAIKTLGIRTYASAPIWIGAAPYGTLVFLRRDPLPGGISDDDKAFMDLLASWLGVTLLQNQQKATLENLAMTDSLTGLPNRRAADTRLAGEMARAKRRDEAVAIALCDLDHFKLINDHYGHDVGDDVLRHAAQVMQAALREGDWMARWGGEEFFVFLHRSDAKEALAAMERVRQAVKSAPAKTRREPVHLTTSIGVGVLRDTHEDVTQLLAEADGCLYEAKRSGRDRVVLSEGEHRGALWQAGQLQRALHEGRIVPAYQNVVNLRNGQVVANEVLARLIDGNGRDVSAKDFVEAAEGINLVHLIDQTIATSAMKHCAASLTDGRHGADFLHFVNLSPQFLARRDLVRQLITDVQAHCAASAIDLGTVKPLVFEITERQPLRDFHGLRHDLQPLLDLGFRLALDDFGSGYSSFLYLAELPISYLKIEGWLVRNMHNNDKVRAIVENIIRLCREQGITSIAESVEDGETAQLLRDMGVDWGQGYYFGAPQRRGD